MTKLRRLYEEQGQSPWLDNLTRPYLRDGTLAHLVDAGIRGVTANPTIFAKAILSSPAYDEQFATLTAQGRSITDAYWILSWTTCSRRSSCYDQPLMPAATTGSYPSR